MAADYFGLAVAWLIVILSNLEDLHSGEPGKRFKAAGIIFLTSLATAYSALMIWHLYDRKRIEPAPSDQVARYLQEASGASATGHHVLVVDDEAPAILRFEADGDGGLAYGDRHRIFLDGRPVGKGGEGANEDSEDSGRGGDVETVRGLEGVDDLEGLAVSADGRYVYATTSHSRNKNGKRRAARQFALRGCLRAGRFIVLDRVSLTAALERKIFDGGIADRFTILSRDKSGLGEKPLEIGMEIEGLAADPLGNLYFGLRAPLSREKKNALVARIASRDLFPEPQPECRDRPVRATAAAAGHVHVEEVPMHKDGRNYGIVSMEYDRERGELVLLGNAEEPFAALRPIACRWNPARRASSRRCRFLPDTQEPYWGKLEALVLGPRPGSATVFIDGDKGLGGRVTFDRDDLGF
ncbi:MAG TPA: hypothetical protein VF759_05970 [Allosphingosinicella sp.]|jgi:hypothetical protein